jgi:putative N6-adenine-specific DNA methylase
MSISNSFEIFLVATPGLESVLAEEASSLGFNEPERVAGGVRIRGGWADVWRANLEIRGASKVLVRIGDFRAPHLAQLDKRSRNFPWSEFLRADVPVRVEATCKSSRIYHAGAAAQRISTAIHEELGAPIAEDAEVCIKARIKDDLCIISIDTSGDLLHKRGHKEAVAKAPMRETMASLFLRKCGYDGNEPVLDPMCGSGTFIIEAAEMVAGFKPGRSRSFAFEQLVGFDEAAWQRMREAIQATTPSVRFYGSDRDAGAIKMSRANAERAGVGEFTEFKQHSISDVPRPDGPPGLVIVNPPYGNRLGETKKLNALYGALGKMLAARFTGWRVGLITSEKSLTKVTGLPFMPPGPPIAHGGIKVFLFRTDPLK